MTQQLRKQLCSWKGCKTIIDVDSSLDIPALGAMAGGFCDFHSKVYQRTHEIFKELWPEFSYGSICNYIYRDDKKLHNAIRKMAEQDVRKNG